MTMPIKREFIEQLYYRWTKNLMKTMPVENRRLLRTPLAIIETYRIDTMMEMLNRYYAKTRKSPTYNKDDWKDTMLASVVTRMRGERKRIHAMTVKCPCTLVHMAAAINSARELVDDELTFNTVILLDSITNDTFFHFEENEPAHRALLEESTAVLFPTRPLEVYKACRLFEDERALYSEIEAVTTKELNKRRSMIEAVLGIH